MKKLIALLLLATTPAWALKVNGPLEGARLEALSSDPASGPTGRIIYNTTEAKAKIHTGSSFVPLGSAGAGGLYAGGQNLIVNNSFEQVVTGWDVTSGVGSLMRMSDAALIVPPGVGSARWMPTVGAQTMTGTGITITANDGISGQNGVLSCAVKTTMTTLKMQVYDGTNVISPNGTADVVPSSSAGFKRYSVNFVFPVSGTLSPRFYSGSAGTAYIDDCYMGLAEGFNLGIVDVTTDWTAYTPTFTGFGTVSNIECRHARSGQDLLLQCKWLIGSPTATEARVSLPAGLTSASAPALSSLSIVGKMVRSMVGAWDYSVLAEPGVGYVTFGRQEASLSGLTKMNGDAASGTLSFFARVPVAGWTAQNAYIPNQTSWKVDVNISGANVSLGTAALASYIELSNPSLTMTVNPGSLAAQIPCNLTNPSSGTTCSAGSEILGVVFDVPKTGEAEACFDFGHSIDITGNGANLIAVFQIAETPNSSSTILQNGNTRVGSELYQTATTRMAAGNPRRLCSTFNFTSTGQKTLRLMAVQSVTGTINGSNIYADGAVGSRDVHIVVRPKMQAEPTPYFLGSVTSNTSGMERVERARMLISAACAITDQSGSWISSPSGCVSGQAAFAISGFSGVPACTVSPYGTSAAAACTVRSLSQTSATIACFTTTTGAAVDVNVSLVCMGPK